MSNVFRALVAAAALAGALAAPAAASATASVSGCPWLEFTRLPVLSTFPDLNTQVFQCLHSAGPAHQTVLEGRPPQARFWSFAVLDQTRRELDSIADRDVVLEPDGTYRIVIRDACGTAPNCLDVSGAALPTVPGLVYYRLYVPRVDRRGGVGLPLVRYTLRDGPGGDLSAAEAADALAGYMGDATAPLAAGGTVTELLAGSLDLDPAVAPGATGEAPVPSRYRGLGAKQLATLAGAGVPAPVIDLLGTALGRAGFGATADNAYVTSDYDMRKGNLVVRAKAPTYREQAEVAANDLGRGDGSEQVRYWSLCTTQLTRTVDCARDETVPVDADGYFEAVVAPACPVAGFTTCLRAGITSPAGGGALPTLLYRNTIAAADFANAEGPHVCPATPSMFCGEHQLVARYAPRP